MAAAAGTSNAEETMKIPFCKCPVKHISDCPKYSPERPAYSGHAAGVTETDRPEIRRVVRERRGRVYPRSDL